MNIILTEQFCGLAKTVVSLDFKEEAEMSRYFLDVFESDPKLAKKIRNTLATISHDEFYENKEKFRNIGDNLYEIKLFGIRIYAFQDTISGLAQPNLIIATFEAKKPKKNQQSKDIKKARELKNQYYTLKELEDTELDYRELEHEN